jgi:hypothetical protein
MITRVPGLVALPELLEHIIDKGVVLDGWSQLAAFIKSEPNTFLFAKVAPSEVPVAVQREKFSILGGNPAPRRRL